MLLPLRQRPNNSDRQRSHWHRQYPLSKAARLPLSYIEDILWATQNGAEALGLEDEKGCLTEGQKCGIVLIEGIERGADDELYLSEKSTARRLV